MAKKELFGAVALRLGLIDKKQLEEGLNIQKQEDGEGKSHRLLGLILLELGYLSTTDLVEVLRHMEQAQGRREPRP